jgi:hypothetical protein
LNKKSAQNKNEVKQRLPRKPLFHPKLLKQIANTQTSNTQQKTKHPAQKKSDVLF